jgi:hypothetical protein
LLRYAMVPPLAASRAAIRTHRNVSLSMALPICMMWMGFPCSAAGQQSGASTSATSISGAYTIEQRNKLKEVRTVLVGIEASTAGSVEASPYEVVVSVKLKLEAAGYQVVLDSRQPHDAVLVIEYREMPGREYGRLETGTKIACTLLLFHASIGRVLSYALEAETSWPQPFGSLYWDAVQNLEENPYYYFLGPLIHGWLTSQADLVEVFSNVLREPAIIQPSDGSDNVLTSQMAANQNARLHAIEQLGKRHDTRALKTLWHLAWESGTTEGRAAVAAIGEIRDPASVPPLQELASGDGPLRSAASGALERMQSR